MIGRLSEFIKFKDISVRSFEQKISASDGMIRRAIGNNTDIQSKWITKIADNYPQLNIDWLMTGRGDMLNQNDNTSFSQSIKGNNNITAGRNINTEKDEKILIAELRKQIENKDNLINNLLKQNELLINQINILTSKLT